MNNNEKLIKQIAEIEKEQYLPAGYIAELLYQSAKDGRAAGKALSEILANTIEDGSLHFNRLSVVLKEVCEKAPPGKLGITKEEMKAIEDFCDKLEKDK